MYSDHPEVVKLFLFIHPIRQATDKVEALLGKILHMQLPYTEAELVELTIELCRRGNWREDVYIRPMVYKSSEVVGVKLHGIEDDLLITKTGCEVLTQAIPKTAHDLEAAMQE